MDFSACITVVQLSNDVVLIYGRQKMLIPTTTAQRQCSFFIPMLEVASPDDAGAKCSPTILATIDNQNNVDTTTIMVVYGVDLSVVSQSVLEIKISAANPEAINLDGDYFCNISVMGTPVR
jgi:hypothetical protein